MKARKLSLRSSNRYLALLGCLFLLGLFDFFVKRVVVMRLAPDLPIFHNQIADILFYKNYGIAFSLPVPVVLSVLISLGLISYFFWATAKLVLEPAGIAAMAVVIGALSNLYDRLTLGYVVDYLLFFGRSAMNAADILIVTGILLYIWYTDVITKHSPS